MKEIDCNVVAGIERRQHQMVVCRMTLEAKKRKRMKAEPSIKWWNLKKEDSCVDFKRGLRQVLGGSEELLDGLVTTAEVVRETVRKVLGLSSG